MFMRGVFLTGLIVLIRWPLPADETNAASHRTTINSMTNLDNTHKLGPGDRVTYRVLEDQDEPVSLIITDSGDLPVPYLGLVRAMGKTSLALAKEIKKMLEHQHYYQATVIIAVELVNKTRVTGKVYVTGYVRNPGGYDIPAGESFTVSKAILKAGGFSDFSDRRRVRVVRATDSENKKTYTVNVQEIWDKGKLEDDMEIQPEDLIVVSGRLVNF
jgi:protein involved in polysaccharide export with SLBB domain